MSRKIDRVYFELTTMCNLRCRHCFNYNDNFKPENLSLKVFMEFYQNIRNKTEGIVLTGGEPFLHPEIEDFLELLKTERVVITTNATAKSKEYLEKILVKYPNVFLQVSFDGMTKEVFEKVRGNGTYKKVKTAVDYLCERGLSKKIGLSTSILSYNIHEVFDIIQYARKKSLHSIHFPTLIMEGRCVEDKSLLPDVEILNNVEDKLLGLAVECDDIHISVNTLNRVAGWMNLDETADCLSNATVKVTVDGEIMPCPVAWKAEESLGRIEDIFCFQDLLETLERIQVKKKVSENCGVCDARSLCTMNFCEHCSIRNNENPAGMQYRCLNLRHHINNIRKEEEYGKHVNDI